MAKLVEVRYGLSNLSKDKYTYMVNDNVKRGSVLMPVVKHAVSGKEYTTMAVVQHAYNGNNPKAQALYKNLEGKKKSYNNGETDVPVNIKVAEKISRQATSSLVGRNEKNRFAFEDLHGFSTKKSIFAGDKVEDASIGVGNEKYEAHKDNDVIQDERKKNVDNLQTANSSGMKYDEFYKTYMQGE